MFDFVNGDSDVDIDDEKHQRLLDNILSLNSAKRVKKPTRTEPAIEVSEFNLVRSKTGKKDVVHLKDLTHTLSDKLALAKIKKKFERTNAKSKTLRKPLDKPQAERIKRTVSYEKAKKQLNRWEPIVTSNRVVPTISFPLNIDTKVNNTDVTSEWRVKSDLEKKLEDLEPKVELFNIETENSVQMSMKEMMERRKEIAYLRRRESYKAIKVMKQNKIKSKKYRRVLRKEHAKSLMKDFEALQKDDPEEALRKLEEIEKSRAQERASLRHKNTGKWAKNQQIRAKYDKESRQVLAQQLAISKELMQKGKRIEDSDSDNELATLRDGKEIANPRSNEGNTWVGEVTPSEEVANFIERYNKFRIEKIKGEERHVNVKNKLEDSPNDKQHQIDNGQIKESYPINVLQVDSCTETKSSLVKKNVKKVIVKTQYLNDVEKRNQEREKQITKQENKIAEVPKDEHHEIIKKVGKKILKQTNGDKHRNKKRKSSSSSEMTLNGFTITKINTIDDIFDDLEFKIKKELKVRRDAVFSNVKTKQTSTHKSKNLKVDKTDKLSLNIPNSKVIPVIDEELIETNQSTSEVENKDLDILKSVLTSKSKTINSSVKEIKPKKKISKPIILKSSVPDSVTAEEDNELVDENALLREEAFQDDNAIDEFIKDKKEAIRKDEPEDVDLSLQGWGSWGGCGIGPNKKKQKRFTVKYSQGLHRKDKDKINVIINESSNNKLKKHLVSELPFPFKTVKDFEASIRAPIGNTFVPENAFQRMIKPPVTTKLGTIIEPMTEDVLLKKTKRTNRRQ